MDTHNDRADKVTSDAGSHNSYLYDGEGRRVAPVSVNVSNHAEGAPGPSHLGTGEGQVAQSQSVKMCAERKEAVPRSSRFCDEAGVRR
jgi:hypothetical protein